MGGFVTFLAVDLVFFFLEEDLFWPKKKTKRVFIDTLSSYRLFYRLNFRWLQDIADNLRRDASAAGHLT